MSKIEDGDFADALPFQPVAMTDGTTVSVVAFEECEVTDFGVSFGNPSECLFERECDNEDDAIDLMDRVSEFLVEFAEKSDRATMQSITLEEVRSMLRKRFCN